MTAFDDAAERVAAGADHRNEARLLIASMTLEEKLDCLDGDTDFWSGLHDMNSGGYHAHPWPAAVVERLGVPGIHFADGPRGCVIDPATAFPVSMARGATFDPGLEERIGEAVGAELAIHGANFTGAVCLNLLRHPAWGRAQETYGEDPHHVGEMAAAFTRGLQHHVMACMKHFALNSMENARFKVDVRADDRALHEVYLPHFRRVAAEGVASTMSAYNSVNGAWCGDDPVLLTDVLRREWGWDGFVITDFIFGLRDPIGSVGAGCDIEMPFRQQRAEVLGDAVADGRLSENTVDAAVENIVSTLLRFAPILAVGPDPARLESAEHRTLSREAATSSTVLLSNDGSLPLEPDSISSVAVLGRLADVVNLGDGGSSNVHPTDAVTVLAGLRDAFGSDRVVHDPTDASIAADADVTVVVVGYTAADEGEYIGEGMLAEVAHLFPTRRERRPSSVRADAPPAPPTESSEASASADESSASSTSTFHPGGDRRSLRLSQADEALIAAAVESSERVIVVVMGGSAIVMPWLDDPAAVMQIWYPGVEGGRAVAEVLLGDVEPGGRLPFVMAADAEHHVEFDPEADRATYGLFHGQWHLDRAGVEPTRPFGFGLGYTSWDLVAVASSASGDRVRATVANTGDRAGSTVVFVFGGLPESNHERPLRRLVGFARVAIEAGERVDVDVTVEWSQLDVRHQGDHSVESGDYVLSIGFDAASTADTLIVRR